MHNEFSRCSAAPKLLTLPTQGSQTRLGLSSYRCSAAGSKCVRLKGWSTQVYYCPFKAGTVVDKINLVRVATIEAI
jgi:hypothetical protein